MSKALLMKKVSETVVGGKKMMKLRASDGLYYLVGWGSFLIDSGVNFFE